VNSDIDPVRAQYERWPYPPPLGDDLEKLPQYLKLYENLRNFTPRFWPAGKPREHPSILVAGCGTMAAACYAFVYPQSRVVGIDISAASLAFETNLKNRHRLQNLTLAQCAIEDGASLGERFDYIACQGVLHHTAQPAMALGVLGNLLTQDGIMRVAIYGKYPREQVYALQRLFRIMDLDQSPESVSVVRETLSILPASHPHQAYLRGAVDHTTSAGLVDTYLHGRDRAYTVPDCLALVAAAGLVFQGWDMNFDYHPDGALHAHPSLRDRINAMPEEEIWHAMEIICGSIRMHEFHVCRRDRDPAHYRIPWESDQLLSCIPGHCVDLVQAVDRTGARTWAIGRGTLPVIPLTPAQAMLFAQINGTRNVRECLAAAGISGPNVMLLDAIRPLLRLLWCTGYGVLCLPGKSREP